jgi:hypothetical protein
MKKQNLSERQARWAERLMRYKFSLVYRPGAEAVVPDALSRREQDTLGKDDHESRYRQLIPEESLQEWPRAAPFATEEEEEPPATTSETPEGPLQDPELNAIWRSL